MYQRGYSLLVASWRDAGSIHGSIRRAVFDEGVCRYAGRFVGLDLHRRRTVIATEGGKVLEDVRIVNDVERFAYFSA